MTAELTRQLRGDEDVRPCVYKDHLGWDTIACGRLVDSRKPGCGLRPSEIDFMLANDIADRTEALNRLLPWFAVLDPARAGALLNMSFQLGVAGLLGFKNSLEMMRLGQFDAAADNFLRSKWAVQTPARAKRMAEQIRSGVWQYAPGA